MRIRLPLPFVTIQSIRGGNKLDSLGVGYRKLETIQFHEEETARPVVVQDYFCFVLGYSASEIKKGDRMYMKQSDCETIYKLLKRQFEPGRTFRGIFTSPSI